MREEVLGRLVFGSLGFTEIAFILILALLLFGPKRLPEIGKTLGKGLAEFRRASNELKRTLETEVAEEERAARRPAATLAPMAPPDPAAPLASVAALTQAEPVTPENAPRVEAAAAAAVSVAPAAIAPDAAPAVVQARVEQAVPEVRPAIGAEPR